MDWVCYCLCFINILLYKCQLYHFPHHCFTTPLALSSGTRGGTSLSLISLYRFSPSPLPKSLYSFSLFFPSFLTAVFLSLLSPSPSLHVPSPFVILYLPSSPSFLSLCLSWQCVTGLPPWNKSIFCQLGGWINLPGSAQSDGDIYLSGVCPPRLNATDFSSKAPPTSPFFPFFFYGRRWRKRLLRRDVKGRRGDRMEAGEGGERSWWWEDRHEADVRKRRGGVSQLGGEKYEKDG